MGIPISKATNVEKNACLTVNFSALKMYFAKTLFEVSKLEKEEFEKYEYYLKTVNDNFMLVSWELQNIYLAKTDYEKVLRLHNTHSACPRHWRIGCIYSDTGHYRVVSDTC